MKINLSGLVLLTGKPGAGKTLRMIEYMQQAIADGRPCYACNIDGINMPGVMPWEQPHDWQELPATAVLFVDEAQKFFRTRRGMVDPPESIKAMETIRHDGVCIVMTTQQPTYLDKHLRGLVGHHEHLVELIAGQVSNVYTFRECAEDVTPSARDGAQFEAWRHPKRLHKAYKSAEVHTKKTLIPTKIKLLAVAALGTVAFVTYAFMPKDDAAHDKPGQADLSADLAGSPPSERATSSDKKGRGTVVEYLAAFTPRIPSQPWSAPEYDGMQPAGPPRVFCMASGAGEDANGEHKVASCRCLTEQGTTYMMQPATCHYIARHGQYEPYLQLPSTQTQAQETMPATDAAAVAPADTAGLIQREAGFAQRAQYGQFRAESPATDPAYSGGT